jgi:hypothetical protein
MEREGSRGSLTVGGFWRLRKSGCGGGSRRLLAEEAVEAWPAWQRRGGALGRSSSSGATQLASARREEEQRRGMSRRKR